ncbi:diphthine synthase [Natrialbaceae archaeon AArc-T1-2]|uniref:diphthine synthase n=1 Tax=Natrialbaceae archaeon AArc-T1-2 TaxID=3053904 RepID=UPI00255B2709|nr:diphthine synthase [Natrialbaceae archaeon AArc-T1-2]WIV67225.1 diphthine synthase [Natrialbaceae archaeon AArc-T1-2]
MLTFIGLGLYDERSITVEGQEALRDADRVFAEFYTSKLVGATLEDLESHHDLEIEVRDRAGVEQEPDEMLEAAETEDVAFLTAGDTMISTTHVDLRLRAHDRGIETRVIHGVTAQTAASSLTGLQNYRFGTATTLPFPYAHGADGLPASVTETIDDNRERGLHTVVYLDIKVGYDPTSSQNASRSDDKVGHERTDEDEYMTADVGAELLAEAYPDLVGVVVARAGSPEPVVEAAPMTELAEREFGDPLHLLVVPGECHLLEADALVELAGADRGALDIA